MTTTAPPTLSPPSWALALLAGAAAFVGVPLGAAAFVMLARWGGAGLEDAGYAGAVSSAWAEGGSPMYLALAAAMLATLIIAVLITAATRASTGVAAALPFLSALPSLAGAAGAKWGMDGAVAAVAHASPDDRVMILFGSAGEAMQASMFGAAMSGGLAIAIGLGLLVGWSARAKEPARRQALLAGALVALSFAAVCFIGAGAIRELAGACKAIAHSGSWMQELVRPMVLELATLQRAWSASVLAALIAVLVGAGVLRAPVAGRVAFGASALLGVSLLGLGTRPHVPANFKEVSVGDAFEPALLVFDAPPLGGAGLLIGEESPEDTQARVRTAYGRWRDLHSYAGDDSGTFGLSLSKDLAGETLAAALETLWNEGARSVTLFTAPTTKPVSDLPPPFDAIRPPSRGVRLELGARRDQCPDDGCELAQLANGTLTLGAEKWPLEERADVEAPAKGQPVLLSLEARPPLELLRAAITAMKHARPLMLVSAHERKPEQLDAPPAPAARAKVELVSLTATGALEAKVARLELAEQLEVLAECVDPDEDAERLPLSAKLELSVDSNGRLLGVEVEGKTDDGFLDCLRAEIPYRWSLSPPKTRGLTIVRAGLRFSALTKK